tara:strand:+ start:2139 stop:3197 length:1059 start_codon:yes stop_codon:yes gene_type:complete
MLDTARAYPGEHVVATSTSMVVAGFVLLLGVAILAIFIWLGRGEQNDSGKEDLLGSRVTIREIASRYRTTWSPSRLGVSIHDHQKQMPEDGGSIVYSIAWGGLLVWLAMTGVFLIIAGAADSIENFREERQRDAAICVCIALAICAAWIPIFRIHSKSPKEVREAQRVVMHIRSVELEANDAYGVDPRAQLPDHSELERGKSAFLWTGFVLLVVAWALALSATVRTQAWTLPSPQLGTLVFVAPGYGLLTGWLLFAASLNFGVAYCSDSCPDGVRAVPENSNGYAYRGSPWPIAVAIIALICAVSIPDPTQPVPLVLTLLLFTPRYRSNLWAAAVGLLGIGLGVLRVWGERS